MQKLCGHPIRQLFLNKIFINKNELNISKNVPKIDLSLIDLQWLQVLAEG